jgi:RNA polymerase sigma-70 factor (ECF subfamily)
LVAEPIDDPDPGPSPEDLLRRGELLSLLGELLRRLPAEHQAILILHEFEEMTLSEIAKMLEIPTGTAASRLRRARIAFDRLVAECRARCDVEEP